MAYYYIDDVNVVDCTEVEIGEEGISNKEFEIHPNPATTNLTIHQSGN